MVPLEGDHKKKKLMGQGTIQAYIFVIRTV